MTEASPGRSVVDREIASPDGRILVVQEGGDPGGRAVLAHHGIPSSRLLFWPNVRDAQRRGIRLISYDRPGYGRSTPQPGRTVSDCAADVQTIADALGVDRFGVWGVSGGGPHALACAALLADRVVAVATLASPAPYGAEDLDYFAGTGQENIDDDLLALSDPAAARDKLARDREEILHPSPPDLARAHPTLFSGVDAAALTEEVVAHNMRRYRDGLADGIEGWWDDSLALLRPWGFSPAQITVPVMLWHGRRDRMVPVQHGEWLAQRVPGAEAHITDEDGHLTLRHRIPQIHAWLLAHF